MASAAAVGLAAALGAPAVGTLGFVFYEAWGYSASLLNMVKGLGSGGVFLALALATGMQRRLVGRAGDVGSLVLSAFLGITLGDTAWLEALQLLGATRVILVTSLKPFVAWVFGALFLKERTLTLSAVAGLALTVGGVALVAIKPEEPGAAEKTPGGASGGAALRKGYVMAFLSMLMDVAGSVFTRTSAVHGRFAREVTTFHRAHSRAALTEAAALHM